MPLMEDSHKHTLIYHVSKIAVVVIVTGSILRPLLIELPPLFSWFGAFNTTLSLLVFLAIRARTFPGWELHLLLGLAFVTLIPLQFLSGGVNSQYSFMMPLLPMAAALMGGRRVALSVTVIQIAQVLVMLACGESILDMTGETYVPGKSNSRGLWLLISISASAYVGIYFHQLNSRLQEQLETLATQDPLTGLLNRRGFDEQFDRELKRRQRLETPLSVLVADIDHFKLINDRYGHDAGDRCLISLAKCFREQVRDIDLVARIGGEEFVVVLINTSIDQASLVAEQLQGFLHQVTSEEEIAFTITIGMSHIDGKQSTSRDLLIKQADQALYEGKRAGRNCIKVFTG